MQFLSQDILRRKPNHIFRHTDRVLPQFQQFDLIIVLFKAQDDTRRGVFVAAALKFIKILQVELYLAFMRRLKFTDFQFNRRQPLEAAIDSRLFSMI